MSLSSFVISGSSKIGFNHIDVDELDIDNVPFSGGGGGSGSVAGALAYTNNIPQTLPNAGNTNLIFGSSDSSNTFGSTNLSTVLDGSNIIGIRNTGSSSINVLITGYCSYNGLADGSYAIWINKNGSDSDRYGLSETVGDNDYVILNFTCSLQLAVNDYINLRTWVNATGGTVSGSNASFTPALRIIVTQMNEGAGSLSIEGDTSLDISSNGSTITLSNCGKTWSNFSAIADVNINNNNITGVSSIQIAGVSQTISNNVLTLECTDGSSAKVYDDTHYKPSLSSVIIASNDALGHSAIGFNSITCNNINVTTVNGSSYPPAGTGGSVGNLSQVLTAGNSAGELNITSLNSLTLGNGAYTSSLVSSVSNKGVLTIGNPINSNASNVFDDIFNCPAYFSVCSYASAGNLSFVSVSASTGATPTSLSFGSLDFSQSMGTTPLTLSTISVTLNGTTYHYYCYKNQSPNTISCNVSLFATWDQCSEGYRGLYANYVPASMVSGMTANNTYSLYSYVLGGTWEYYVDNYPVSNLQFNTILAHGDSFQVWALSNQNTNIFSQIPAGQQFGGVPNVLAQNGRMTVISNYRLLYGAYPVDS